MIADGKQKGRKIAQVLDGARDVFLRDGYEGASVDEIARAADVSKATLYSYFADKRALFLEVARIECRRQAAQATSSIDTGATPRDVLFRTGSQMVRFFLSDFGQSVFRICVAETDRFPELGRQFYDSGPAVMETTLCGYFDHAIARGELEIADQRLAANQFAELCKARLFPRLVFGVQSSFDDDEIDLVVAGAVDMFIARYGRAS